MTKYFVIIMSACLPISVTKEKLMPTGNIIVADADVFVHDPDAVDVLRHDGNILVLPLSVIYDLERLRAKPDYGLDADVAIRKLDALFEASDPSLRIIGRVDYSGLDYLERNNPNFHIIALVRQVYNERHRFALQGKIKLVTRSSTLRIMAKEFFSGKDGIVVQDYYRDQVGPINSREIKQIVVPEEKINIHKLTFSYDEEQHGDVMLNEGVVCNSNYDPSKGVGTDVYQPRFVALRKGQNFRIIPHDIDLMGLKPTAMNGSGPNWTQYVVMAQLMDPDIHLVFMEGVAGTGKTLLALAGALEQRHKNRIMVSRPMIPLEDKDRMGFLPGDEQQKISPWMRPIIQALDFIGATGHKDNKKVIENLQRQGGFILEPLEYIRGSTYHNTVVIIDEAQNLTPHMIKTIITRAGRHSKLIFTGDLDQIDRNRVDSKSSGLAYAIKRMRGNRIVAVTHFHETVRSPLASLAKDLL